MKITIIFYLTFTVFSQAQECIPGTKCNFSFQCGFYGLCAIRGDHDPTRVCRCKSKWDIENYGTNNTCREIYTTIKIDLIKGRHPQALSNPLLLDLDKCILEKIVPYDVKTDCFKKIVEPYNHCENILYHEGKEFIATMNMMMNKLEI